MQKLVDAFAGNWNVTETFEVSASQQGKTRGGTASFRLGPGASLTEDYRSNGSAGELKFLALPWWDRSAHVYRLLTCANNDSYQVRGTASWEGKEFVNSWEEKVDGTTALFKDSFVDISPSSFRLVSEGTGDGKTIWRVITTYERPEEGVFVTIPSGHSVTIDGKVTTGEWEDAQSIPISIRNDWNIRVRFKHDQEYLYLLFDGVTHGGERLFPEVFVDPEYWRIAQWQKGQWWFHVSYNLCEGNGEPNIYTKGGVFQCAHEKEGWAANNPPSKDTQAIGVKVSLSKLGVKPAAGHQLGLAFVADSPARTWAGSSTFWAETTSGDRRTR